MFIVKEADRGFRSKSARAPAYYFSRKFLCSRFSRLLTSKGDEQGSQSGKAEVVTHGNIKVVDMSL